MIGRILRNTRFIDMLGWSGSSAIIGAYGMTTHGLSDNQNLLDGMNMYGALTVGLICYRQKAWQPFTLEAIWFGIAGSSLLKNMNQRNGSRNQ